MPMAATIEFIQNYVRCTTSNGIPLPVFSYHSRTITHMVSRILTAHYESSVSINNTHGLKLGKNGQGCACSDVSWHYHMEPLLEGLPKFSHVFQFTDITNLVCFLQYMTGYIDENLILCSLPNSSPTHEILQIATTV